MESICGKPAAWNQIRKHWLQTEVFIVHRSYQVGKHSKCYALGPAWSSAAILESFEIEDEFLARKIRTLRDEFLSSQPPIVKLLEAAAQGVTVYDLDESVQQHTWLATKEGRAMRARWKRKIKVASALRVAINEANRGNFGFTHDSLGHTQRVHSSTTKDPHKCTEVEPLPPSGS